MFKRLTTSQRRGVLVLLAVIAAVIGWRWRVSVLDQQKTLPDLPDTATTSASDVAPPAQGEKTARPYTTSNKAPVRVNLNSADTTELMRVRGIGPVFARRIVKYRRLIGGFKAKEDLQKVYGIDAEKYAGIAPQVYVEPGAPLASPDPDPAEMDLVASPTEPPAPVTSCLLYTSPSPRDS